MNGRGLIPQDPATRVVRASAADHHLVRGALKSLRGSADLTPFAPKVLNQAQSETCAEHSGVGALFTRTNSKAGAAVAVLQSPLYAAQIVYSLQRAAQFPTGNMPPLVDAGTDLDSADAAWGRWGTIRFQTPQQTLETDVPATDAQGYGIPDLDMAELTAGAAALLAGPFEIPVDGNIGDTAAATLESGTPLWIGGPIDQTLDNLQAGQVEQPATIGAPGYGGHARYIIGYKTVTENGTLKRRWLIRGSWGASFCDGGNDWADETVLMSLWQCVAFQV